MEFSLIPFPAHEDHRGNKKRTDRGNVWAYYHSKNLITSIVKTYNRDIPGRERVQGTNKRKPR